MEGRGSAAGRTALSLLLGIAAATYVAFSVYQVFVANGENFCGMSYMWPLYFPIPVESAAVPDGARGRSTAGYALYLYRDGNWAEGATEPLTEVHGTPVLFVPGNAGSYRQVRSIASREHATSRAPALDGRLLSVFDYFSIDFADELSAFHGEVLWDQSWYVNECIRTILALYAGRQNAPRSVVIVGHSMGGMAARAAVTLPNYTPGSIETIVTLATPHRAAPLLSDQSVARFYDAVNGFWTRRVAPAPEAHSEGGEDAHLAQIILVSVAGGRRDALVRSDLCGISGLVHASRGLALSTTALEGAWAAPDHLAIVWCEQVVRALDEALHVAVTRRTPEKRLRAFRSRLAGRTPALLGLRGAQDADRLSSARGESAEARAQRDSKAQAACRWARAAEQSGATLRTERPASEAYAWAITDKLRRAADHFVLLADRPIGSENGPSVFLCGGSEATPAPPPAGAAEGADDDAEEFEGGTPEGKAPEARREKKEAAAPARPVDVSPLAFAAPGLRPAFQGPEPPPADRVPPFPTSALLLPASMWRRHDRLLVSLPAGMVGPTAGRALLFAQFYRGADSRAETIVAVPPQRAELPTGRPALVNVTVRDGASAFFPPSVWLESRGEPLFHPLAYYAYPPAGIAEEVFVPNATSLELRLHEAPPSGAPPRSDLALFLFADPAVKCDVTVTVHFRAAAAQLWRWFGPALLPTAAAAVAMGLVRHFNAWRTTGEAPHVESALLGDALFQCVSLFLAGRLLPGWYSDGAATAGAPFPYYHFLLPAMHLLALGLVLLVRRVLAAPIALLAAAFPSPAPPPGPAPSSPLRRPSYALLVALACTAHPAYALAASCLFCLLPLVLRLSSRRLPPGSQEESDRRAALGSTWALLLTQLLALAAVAPAGAAWTLRLVHGHWILQADATAMAAAVCAVYSCSLAWGGGPRRPKLAAFGEGGLRSLQTRAFSMFGLSHCFARPYCIPYVPAFVCMMMAMGTIDVSDGPGAPAAEGKEGQAGGDRAPKGREPKKRK